MLDLNGSSYDGSGWATAGAQAAWAVGNIAADTGALSAGIYDFFIIVGSGAGLTSNNFRLEHRNAGNTATLHDQMMGGSGTYFGTFTFVGYKMVENERMRVYCFNAYGNPAQISIIWTRRYTG